jgi:hypothetical protein
MPIAAAGCETDVDLVARCLMRQHSARALLLGTPGNVDAVLAEIHQYCAEPILDAWEPSALPTRGRGTVVLHDLTRLAPAEQHALSAWIGAHGLQWSLLATTPVSLHPLVTCGAFSAELFYRLNIISVECDEGRPTTIAGADLAAAG